MYDHCKIKGAIKITMGVIVVRHPKQKVEIDRNYDPKSSSSSLSRKQGNKCLPNISNRSILYST